MDSTTEIDCLVFSTSIQNEKDLKSIASVLNHTSNITDWSVDLEDWEKVLRVVGKNIDPSVLRLRLREKGVLIRQMSTC